MQACEPGGVRNSRPGDSRKRSARVMKSWGSRSGIWVGKEEHYGNYKRHMARRFRPLQKVTSKNSLRRALHSNVRGVHKCLSGLLIPAPALTSAPSFAYTPRQPAVWRQRLRLLLFMAHSRPEDGLTVWPVRQRPAPWRLVFLRGWLRRPARVLLRGPRSDPPEKRRETHLSTEQARPQAPSRFPCAQGHARRPQGAGRPPFEGTQAAFRLIAKR